MEMTQEEIMSYQGHEFTYVFPNGDTMPAYIKKIDLEKDLISCWSFSRVTDQGHEFSPLNEEEKIEDACCIAYEDEVTEIIKIIIEIKTTGKLINKEAPFIPGSFRGCPF